MTLVCRTVLAAIMLAPQVGHAQEVSRIELHAGLVLGSWRAGLEQPGITVGAGIVRWARDTTRSARLGAELLQHPRPASRPLGADEGRAAIGVTYDYRWHLHEQGGALRVPIGVGLYLPAPSASDGWIGVFPTLRAGMGGEFKTTRAVFTVDATVNIMTRGRAFVPVVVGVRW